MTEGGRIYPQAKHLAPRTSNHQHAFSTESVMIGQSPEEALKCDLSMEDKATADLREAIPYCESVRDFVSRDLLAHILHDEEEHIDFIETQFDLIERIGLQNWMQLNSGASD